ncbi:MAG: hypothetical protein ACHQZR_07955 [Candidatus Limnocylindrales bacterium]
MGRVLDRGAIFAGWVGLGMAVTIAISFELVVAVQALVFLAAVPAGLLIGFYAGARSERRRPVWRALVDAGYAGLVTGVSLAVVYAAVRLLFIYADSGYPSYNQVDVNGQPVGVQCAAGPGCAYQRYLDQAKADPAFAAALSQAGVTDTASFEAYVLHEELNGGLILVGMVVGGALVGGAFYAIAGPAERREPAAAS